MKLIRSILLTLLLSALSISLFSQQIFLKFDTLRVSSSELKVFCLVKADVPLRTFDSLTFKIAFSDITHITGIVSSWINPKYDTAYDVTSVFTSNRSDSIVMTIKSGSLCKEINSSVWDTILSTTFICNGSLADLADIMYNSVLITQCGECCGTICYTVPEHQTLTMTAPTGAVFTSIDFASYGTLSNNCSNGFTAASCSQYLSFITTYGRNCSTGFIVGSCNSATSISKVSTAALGYNSFSISAENSVFGDPCVGTYKRLSITATYCYKLAYTVGPLSLSNIPLPINIVYFILNNNNQLLWSTASEVNSDKFEVENSSDGKNFIKVGEVKGSGNSFKANKYSFNLPKFDANIVYFRLKQVYFNNNFIYSNIIVNKVNNITSNNPITDFLNVNYISNGDVSIKIVSLNGKEMYKEILSNKGHNSVSINTSNFNSGVYILTITSDGKTDSIKIFK